MGSGADAHVHVVCFRRRLGLFFFFFNDTATTEIYTLSLHDALPIYVGTFVQPQRKGGGDELGDERVRSEEHTSELQSRVDISYADFCLKKKTKKRSSSSVAVARVCRSPDPAELAP